MPRQPNLNSEEYYEILGCERNANESQLKKAYRKLAGEFFLKPDFLVHLFF